MVRKLDLYIARHGESLGNTGEDNCIDPILSETGLKQAECLGNRMEKIHLDAIISSPLVRSVQTASKTAEKKMMKIEVFPLLMEVGTENGYEGMGLDSLREIYRDTEMFSDGEAFPMSLSDENKEIAYARAKEVIRRIRLRFSEDSSVILFAHGTFNNYLINAAIGFEVRDDFNFCQENTGLTCIRFIKDNGAEKIKLEFSNDYCHLNKI